MDLSLLLYINHLPPNFIRPYLYLIKLTDIIFFRFIKIITKKNKKQTKALNLYGLDFYGYVLTKNSENYLAFDIIFEARKHATKLQYTLYFNSYIIIN